MSASKPASATIGKWLRDNGHSLGGLTGQDWPALKAAVEAANLWIACDDECKGSAAQAFCGAVCCMQPGLRYLAYHAVAHVGDWSHRPQLWSMAGLEPFASGVPACKYGPRLQEATP